MHLISDEDVNRYLSNRVVDVIDNLIPGQMITIDWVRIEDGTVVSINGKLHRKDNEKPYVWFTKTGEARVIMTGSAVPSRTEDRNDGKHERNQSMNDKGMAYWTVPLSHVVRVKANKTDKTFGRFYSSSFQF